MPPYGIQIHLREPNAYGSARLNPAVQTGRTEHEL